MAVTRQHGQAVALPKAGHIERIEPDRSADSPVRQADDMDGRRIAVMGVRVTAARCPSGPPNSPCSMTKTWCLIRKYAHRSAAVAAARQEAEPSSAPGAGSPVG